MKLFPKVETKAILKSPYLLETPNPPSMSASLDLLNQITSSTPNLVLSDPKPDPKVVSPAVKDDHTYQTVAQVINQQKEEEHPPVGQRISSGECINKKNLKHV